MQVLQDRHNCWWHSLVAFSSKASAAAQTQLLMATSRMVGKLQRSYSSGCSLQQMQQYQQQQSAFCANLCGICIGLGVSGVSHPLMHKWPSSLKVKDSQALISHDHWHHSCSYREECLCWHLLLGQLETQLALTGNPLWPPCLWSGTTHVSNKMQAEMVVIMIGPTEFVKLTLLPWTFPACWTSTWFCKQSARRLRPALTDEQKVSMSPAQSPARTRPCYSLEVFESSLIAPGQVWAKTCLRSRCRRRHWQAVRLVTTRWSEMWQQRLQAQQVVLPGLLLLFAGRLRARHWALRCCCRTRARGQLQLSTAICYSSALPSVARQL